MKNMKYKLIIGIVLLCLIIVLIVQNATVVEIKLFFWTIAMSRVILMFIILAIGIIIGWLLKHYHLHRKKVKAENSQP